MSGAGKESLLEFPVSFPIKIMGREGAAFRQTAIALVERHTGKLDDRAVTEAASRKGNFVSLTVTIEARSQDQLDAIYRDLSAHEDVLVAL